jgi:hypothetical protein
VSNIKPLVESQGVFEQVGLVELTMQKSCLMNFFRVLKDWYGKNWAERNNVFLSSAGFTGAIDFLKVTLIPYCNLAKDFTAEYMKKGMELDHASIIDRDELKGLQGRAAWNKVQQRLKSRFKSPAAATKIKV